MFIELRQYKILPGQIDNWVKFFEEEIAPFQTAQGMNILGSFRGEEDPSTFIWIRRFESEEERERLYEAVYQSEHWTQNVAPHIPAMMDRSAINVQRIVSTPGSDIK